MLDSGIDLVLKTHEVTAYLYRLARMLDDFNIDSFVDEFTDNGSYRLITRTNYERGLLIHVIDDDKPRLKYRRTAILKYWHYEQFRSTRQISNVLVDFPSGAVADATSNFVVFHTTAEGIACPNLVGVLNDRIVFDGTRWRIKDRLAILENSLPEEAIVVPP